MTLDNILSFPFKGHEVINGMIHALAAITLGLLLGSLIGRLLQ